MLKKQADGKNAVGFTDEGLQVVRILFGDFSPSFRVAGVAAKRIVRSRNHTLTARLFRRFLLFFHGLVVVVRLIRRFTVGLFATAILVFVLSHNYLPLKKASAFARKKIFCKGRKRPFALFTISMGEKTPVHSPKTL